MLEGVVAAHSGGGGLIEIPWPEPPAGLDDSRRGRIGESRRELHGLADSCANQTEFANVPLHGFARRVFAQYVELCSIGLDLVDDEICQTRMPPRLPARSTAVLGRNVNLEAVELQPTKVNRTAEQKSEKVALHRQVLCAQERRQSGAAWHGEVVRGRMEVGDERDVQVLQLDIALIVLPQGHYDATLQPRLHRRGHRQKNNCSEDGEDNQRQ